tara:strand:+ start:1506 stop:1766 length:261 start_codon:yes stop_codon:yes gene_type:complete
MNIPYDFTCGPFASSSIGLKKFGFSMYEAILFQQSIEAQMKLENELNLAIENGEEVDVIETKQREVDYLSCLFELSLSIALDDELH